MPAECTTKLFEFEREIGVPVVASFDGGRHHVERGLTAAGPGGSQPRAGASVRPMLKLRA